MADRKEPRPVPLGAVKPEPPPPPPRRLENGSMLYPPPVTDPPPGPPESSPPPAPIVLEVTREEAEILAIALFGKIQLLERNECDIRDWCDIDVWKLYCRIGQAMHVPKAEPPPNCETADGDITLTRACPHPAVDNAHCNVCGERVLHGELPPKMGK